MRFDMDNQKQEAFNAFHSGDFLRASELFHLLAEQGDCDAYSFLSIMYGTGLAVSQDHEKELEYLIKASELGDGNSSFSIALRYLRGNSNIEPNRLEAERWYRIAKDQGAIIPKPNFFDYLDPELPESSEQVPHLREGIEAYQAKDYDKAFVFFYPFAERGDSVAQLIIAKMYQYGLGVDKNEVEALKFYKSSSALGNGEASYYLCMIFREGECGTSVNKEESARYHNEAISQGFITSEGLKAVPGVDVKVRKAFIVLPSGTVIDVTGKDIDLDPIDLTN
jgi:TPR repeat protein